MGMALRDQPLNSPQSNTCLASGLKKAKLTVTVCGSVLFGVWAGKADFSGDLGGTGWTRAFGVVDATAGDTFSAEAVTGAFWDGDP